MSMKNSSDTIGNRTRDLPACSAVPQPTVPPRAPLLAICVHLSLSAISPLLEVSVLYYGFISTWICIYREMILKCMSKLAANMLSTEFSRY